MVVNSPSNKFSRGKDPGLGAKCPGDELAKWQNVQIPWDMAILDGLFTC